MVSAFLLGGRAGVGGEVLLETNSSAENTSPKRGIPRSTADSQATSLPVQRLPGSLLRLLSVAVIPSSSQGVWRQVGIPRLAFPDNFCVESSWSGLAFPAVPPLRNELALSASCSLLLPSLAVQSLRLTLVLDMGWADVQIQLRLMRSLLFF